MDTLIECAGITLGNLFIPAFELQAGQVVCLHMPEPASSAIETLVVGALSGKCQVPDLRVSARVLRADPGVMASQRFLQRVGHLFHRPLIESRVARLAGVTQSQARGLMQRHGLTPKIRVGGISQNPRVLLALEVTWARGAGCHRFLYDWLRSQWH